MTVRKVSIVKNKRGNKIKLNISKLGFIITVSSLIIGVISIGLAIHYSNLTNKFNQTLTANTYKIILYIKLRKNQTTGELHDIILKNTNINIERKNFINELRNADVNILEEDEDGWTPLHIASLRNNHYIVSALIAEGAKIDAKEKYGWTPLHIALLRNNNKVTTILINEDADINARDEDEWTPLHIAILFENRTIVTMLIEKKAELQAITNDGITPLQLAIKVGNNKIIDLLKNAGVTK